MTPPPFSAHAAHVHALVNEAIAAAQPARVMAAHLRREGQMVLLPDYAFDLARGRLFLVSVGKAGVALARAAAAALGEGGIAAGIVIAKQPTANLPAPLRYYQGSHPVPDEKSVAAATALADLLRHTRPQDLVLCLVSGGTSSLLSRPRLPLAPWQALNQALLHSGCPINELNHVRQQFDAIKGGGLARLAAPASVVTLILSDVVGYHLAHIGSGPTVITPLDAGKAQDILNAYNVWSRLDAATRRQVRDLLARPAVAEEAAASSAAITRNDHHIIGDVGLAARAAAAAATARGFTTRLLTTTLTGEARQVGRQIAATARALPPDQCHLYGGETTVTVQGDGYGGRNQEMALAAAISLAHHPNCVIAAFSTDADDGLHPADAPAVAGAYVTGETVPQGMARGLDAARYLANSNSYAFFQALGEGHITAATGTNVNDPTLVLTY